MYVRALSKHSFGCYMLQLLPDGLGENILRLLFSLAHRKPSCETGRRREREWGRRVRHISKSVINLKSGTNDPCQPLFLNDCIVPFPFFHLREGSMNQKCVGFFCVCVAMFSKHLV